MKDILHRTQFEARRTGRLAKSETPETPEAVTVMRVLAAQRIPSELIDAASDVVARKLGIRPSDPINTSDPHVRGILGPAISWLKNGGLDQLAHTAEQLVDQPPQPAVQDPVSTAPIEPAQERPVSENSSAPVQARGDTDCPALAETALFESVEAICRKDMATAGRAGLDKYQLGAIGTLLNASDPLDVVRIVGDIFGRSGAVAGMARLSREASEHAGATEGLRKAVVDYIYGRFVGGTEAGASAMKPEAFLTFIRQNRPVLDQVFDPKVMNGMMAIAADLGRAAQSNAGRQVSGSPLSHMVIANAGGYDVHGMPRAAATALSILGNSVIASARDAGLENVDDLVKQAMLNPALARALIGKISSKTAPKASASLARQLSRLSMLKPMSWDQDRSAAESNDARIRSN